MFPGVITVYEKGWELPPNMTSSELLDDAEALTAARKRFGQSYTAVVVVVRESFLSYFNTQILHLNSPNG